MQMTRNAFLRSLAGAAVAGDIMGSGPAAMLRAQQAARSPARQTRITQVEIFPFSLQVKRTMHIAIGNMAAENVLVRIQTADGLVGWGESSPFAPVTGETQETDVVMGRRLAGIIRGRDPFDIPRIASDMAAHTPGFPSIKAALEMALWDLCGKITGQPVSRLLGRYRDSFETDLTVYLDEPQVMADRAKEIVQSGFKIVKVKLGETPEKDFARMGAIRKTVGDEVRIRIDANQGWTPAEAVRALRGLEKHRLEFCEQPVVYWDWEGLKYVRDNSPIPIMADEAVHFPQDAIQAVRHDAADMINIKLMKSGGILQSIAIAQNAEAANIHCMLGCMSETRVALTAAAHVAASQRAVLYADLDAFTEHAIDPVIGGMEVKDGTIRIPDTPGLGLDLDPAFLRTLRPA